MTTLNIGSGNRIIPGAVNHDIVKHRPEIDIAHDLNNIPWPWPDNSFDVIEMRSVAEHLRLTLIETLNECWRILKPGGKLILLIPIWTSVNVHDDPTHYWPNWSDKVIDFVDPSTSYGQVCNYYTDKKWTIKARGIIKARNLKAEMEPIK